MAKSSEWHASDRLQPSLNVFQTSALSIFIFY